MQEDIELENFDIFSNDKLVGYMKAPSVKIDIFKAIPKY